MGARPPSDREIGARFENGAPMALTDTQIRQAKPKDNDYKLADSGGLYLLVKANGSKLWKLKLRLHGREQKLSFGAYGWRNGGVTISTG